MNLGDKLLKLRKDNKMSQEEFAEALDVTRQTVSNWENEKSYPDLHTLIKISDEFNLSLDVLLKGDTTMVKDIDKKIKKHSLYKGVIVVLVFMVVGLFAFIQFNNGSMNDTAKDYMDNYVKGVKVIEIYDAANKELLVKYDDKHNIDKVISALNIKSWKETEKSIGMNPKYTIKFYCDTTNQDEEKDIKEITLYENGEYATIFITSPGGVKQNYKTSIDISELVI